MTTIKDFCHRDVSTVSADESITRVAQTMTERKVGTVVVLEGDRPVGIITHRDLTRRVLATEKDPHGTRAQEVMSADLIACKETDSVEQACSLMSRKGVRRLPILSDDGGLIGIVSLNDLVILFGQQMTNLAMAVAGSEQGEREA